MSDLGKAALRTRRKRWKRPQRGWKCVDPACLYGSIFRQVGPRTMHGLGWCIACKGGTDCPPGCGIVDGPGSIFIPIKDDGNPVISVIGAER